METVMDELCDTIHNYFVVKGGVHSGVFTITNGSVDCDFLVSGQYFRVKGSLFNDGVWQYQMSSMTDEEFDGEIWAMAVPPAVIALADDIAEWLETNGSETNISPYTSESFNNYSYSRASNTASDGSYSPVTWRNVFAARLSRWRKLP